MAHAAAGSKSVRAISSISTIRLVIGLSQAKNGASVRRRNISAGGGGAGAGGQGQSSLGPTNCWRWGGDQRFGGHANAGEQPTRSGPVGGLIGAAAEGDIPW